MARAWRIEYEGAIYHVLSRGNEQHCDLDLCRRSARISNSVKTDRDLLIYIAWKSGVATNQQIGDLFGLTYSAVSQRARVTRAKLKKDKELAGKYRHLTSRMKI